MKISNCVYFPAPEIVEVYMTCRCVDQEGMSNVYEQVCVPG